MRFKFPVIIMATVMLTGCAVADKHFWEIPDENLSYIALIRTDRENSTAVVYNPNHCRVIGQAACGFFRTHAHAHAMLNHQILSPASYTESSERQADCWAARNADPAEVKAAVAFLTDENRDKSIRLTGNPLERAKHIKACAQKHGNWT